MGSNAETLDMSRNPAVRCSGCDFCWNSAAMAEGLRLLGSCPKCGGVLQFRAEEPAEPRASRTGAPVQAPHLVLGIPRR